MGACVVRQKRIDNESNRKDKRREWRFSTGRKTGKRNETASILKLKQKNIDDAKIDKVWLESNAKFAHD